MVHRRDVLGDAPIARHRMPIADRIRRGLLLSEARACMTIPDAYVADASGKRIIEFRESNPDEKTDAEGGSPSTSSPSRSRGSSPGIDIWPASGSPSGPSPFFDRRCGS
jgi:hypothetical protein